MGDVGWFWEPRSLAASCSVANEGLFTIGEAYSYAVEVEQVQVLSGRFGHTHQKATNCMQCNSLLHLSFQSGFEAILISCLSVDTGTAGIL